jgi:hypothetical protein
MIHCAKALLYPVDLGGAMAFPAGKSGGSSELPQILRLSAYNLQA